MPLDHLPNEIFQHIFLLYSEDLGRSRRRDYGPEFKPRLCDYPIILSAVCKRWQAIAHASPRIWSTLFIVLKEESEDSRAFQAYPPEAVISQWIERSGDSPLSISLRHWAASDSLRHKFNLQRFNVKALDILDALLVPHRMRWRSVDLELASTSITFQSPLASLLGEQLPLLERLSMLVQHQLALPPNELITFSKDMASLITQSPRLVDLSIRSNRFSQQHQEVIRASIPWSNLMHLSLEMSGTFQASKILDILRDRCPHLRSLDCGRSIFSRGSVSNLEGLLVHVQHESLEELSIIVVPAITSDLLDHSTLPNLRRLYIRTFDTLSNPLNVDYFKMFVCSFIAFVKRSGCHIRELGLVGPDIPLADGSGVDVSNSIAWPFHILEALSPTLTSLQVSGTDLRGLVRALTLPAHPSPFPMPRNGPLPISGRSQHHPHRQPPSSCCESGPLAQLGYLGGKVLCPQLRKLSFCFGGETCRPDPVHGVGFAHMVASRFNPPDNCDVRKLRQFHGEFNSVIYPSASPDAEDLYYLEKHANILNGVVVRGHSFGIPDRISLIGRPWNEPFRTYVDSNLSLENAL